MVKVKVEVVKDRVLGRVAARLEGLDPTSPTAKAVMFNIGNLLRNLAIGNINRSGAVDRGLLRASIKFSIESTKDMSRLTIGAYGRKYARIVELGGVFTDQMRKAMFASFREMGMKPRPSKGIIRGGYYKSRPYLGPALRDARPEILRQLRDLVNGKGS